MRCATAIDAAIAWQHADALEARRAYAGVRPDGLPRLRSAQIAPAGKSTAGWFGWQNADGCSATKQWILAARRHQMCQSGNVETNHLRKENLQ